MCLFKKPKVSEAAAAPAPPETLEQEAPSASGVKNTTGDGGINRYRATRTSSRSSSGLTIGGITENTKSGIGIGKIK